MHSIAQILDQKGRDIFAVPPDASVYRAVEIMSDKRVGALLVMDGPQLIGVISERDYARKIILHGRSSRETEVADIMATDVVTISPHHTVDECMTLMTESRVRHLPVLDGQRVVGVLSIGDLVKAKIDDQQRQIESLESYIAGN